VGGAGETEYRWAFAVRAIADQIPRASVRTTLTYRFHPRFTAGVEYNPRASDVGAIANLVAVTETNDRPAVILGTSSDRIGTPRGRSFYATASKSLRELTGVPIAPYVGAAYGTYEDRLRAIAGLNVHFSPRWSSTIIFDGVHVHPLVNFTTGRHAASLVLVRGRHPGLSYSIAF
jgi:hypothetical protein